MNLKSSLIIAALTAATAAFAADVDTSKLPPASTKTGVTFATDIKPIFDASCTSCHGEKKQKGKLRLDSLAGVLKGSEDGKVIVPGDSAKSILVQSVGHVGDKDEYMPPPPEGGPDKKQLKPEQVALIRAWIDQGAK